MSRKITLEVELMPNSDTARIPTRQEMRKIARHLADIYGVGFTIADDGDLIERQEIYRSPRGPR